MDHGMLLDKGLGWRPSIDPRNADFPMRAVLDATIPRRVKNWTLPGNPLDQGREGACVGFGWTAEMLAAPKMARFVDADGVARRVYRSAKQIDEWPGDAYDGTSVLAGAKVLQSQGWMDAYRWGDGVGDVIDAVISQGPVVIGIPWLSGMYDTAPNYMVRLDGNVVGGHCILVTGYHPAMRIAGEKEKLEVVKWRNSWGLGYGRRGYGYVRINDLAQLLADGESCLPIGRKVGWAI
jgi:hypothetical protein